MHVTTDLISGSLNHYLGKYQYIDLYKALMESDFVFDTVSNYIVVNAYTDDSGERYDASITMMGEDLYDGLRQNTNNCVDLHDYSNPDIPNYFYAVMYPSV